MFMLICKMSLDTVKRKRDYVFLLFKKELVANLAQFQDYPLTSMIFDKMSKVATIDGSAFNSSYVC